MGREADQSPPSSAEFKAEWSYTSSPPRMSYSVHRDNSHLVFNVAATRRCGHDGTLIASFRMK